MCLLGLALLGRSEAWFYRLTHNSDFLPTPAAIAIINNTPLYTHIQYYLHLSQHDTESIPLKVMVGCAKWTDCQVTRRDVIYCACKGVFSFQGKAPGKRREGSLWVWSRKRCENVFRRKWHHNDYSQLLLCMFGCNVPYCKRDLHTTVTHISVFMIDIVSSGWLIGIL